MRAVLGIDAAWTAHNPSGIALVVETAGGWRLVAAEPSYDRFLARAGGRPVAGLRPMGSLPDAAALLTAAKTLGGTDVSLATVDMPLALTPITGRRVSDRTISSAYGARKCATHAPSAERPGPISDKLREDFGSLGYSLLTGTVCSPGLAEVYPHPALVELAGASERLMCKASRARLYWPHLSPLQRREKLLQVWAQIATLLERQVKGVAELLPEVTPSSSGVAFKAFEDTLDAIICAWIGICILEGRATSYGDHDSAIWVPRGDAIRR